MGTVGRGVSHEERTDIGYAHLRIPKLELVVWPNGRPALAAFDAAEAAEAVAGGAGGAHCEELSAAAASSAVAGGAGEAAAAAAAPVALGSVEQQQQACTDLPQRGERGAAQRRSAALTQLNSHVASISGRWWDACDGGSLGGAATWRQR